MYIHSQLSRIFPGLDLEKVLPIHLGAWRIKSDALGRDYTKEECQALRERVVARELSPFRIHIQAGSVIIEKSDEFEQDLARWVKNGKEKAVEKIRYAFYNFKQTLDLSGLELSSLPKCLALCTTVKSLNLSLNQFRKIPKCVYELTELTYLDLSHNQLHDFQPEIQKLVHLVNLNVSFNLLESVNYINQLPLLAELDLSHNRFSVFPSPSRLTRLKVLNLSYNHLRDLSLDLAVFRSLYHLDLSHNHLRTAIGLKYLNDLRTLDLSHNVDLRFPRDIGCLKRLEELDLSYIDVFVGIPKDIGGAVELKKLIFRGANIKKISEKLWQLKKLRVLDLSENKLRKIPKELAYLKELEILEFDFNPISIEQRVDLSHFSKLKKLSIKGYKNEIFNLEGKYPELESLSITLNFDMLSLEKGRFPKLRHLYFDWPSALLPSKNEMSQWPWISSLCLETVQIVSTTDKVGDLNRSRVLVNPTSFDDKVVRFEAHLEDWVAKEGGSARFAADKIRNVYYGKMDCLSLKHDGLKTLPDIFLLLKGLRAFDLSYNDLEGLPGEASNYPILQVLDIHNNFRFKRISEDLFQQLVLYNDAGTLNPMRVPYKTARIIFALKKWEKISDPYAQAIKEKVVNGDLYNPRWMMCTVGRHLHRLETGCFEKGDVPISPWLLCARVFSERCDDPEWKNKANNALKILEQREINVSAMELKRLCGLDDLINLYPEISHILREAYFSEQKHIDLSSKRLTQFPDVLKYFNHLESLDLSDNPDLFVPDSILDIGLKRINLEGCRTLERSKIELYYIRKELEEWALEEGGLAQSAVERILDAFSIQKKDGDSNADELYLKLNGLKLKTLPPVLGMLHHLEYLDLSANDLHSIDQLLENKKLKYLILDDNPNLLALPPITWLDHISLERGFIPKYEQEALLQFPKESKAYLEKFCTTLLPRQLDQVRSILDYFMEVFREKKEELTIEWSTQYPLFPFHYLYSLKHVRVKVVGSQGMPGLPKEIVKQLSRLPRLRTLTLVDCLVPVLPKELAKKRLDQISFEGEKPRLRPSQKIMLEGIVRFEKELDRWKREHGGRAKEAAERIQSAYYRDRLELNLKGLGLKSLPKSLKYLSSLIKLDLSNNPIEKPAEGLFELKFLNYLKLDGCPDSFIEKIKPFYQQVQLKAELNRLNDWKITIQVVRAYDARSCYLEDLWGAEILKYFDAVTVYKADLIDKDVMTHATALPNLRFFYSKYGWTTEAKELNDQREKTLATIDFLPSKKWKATAQEIDQFEASIEAWTKDEGLKLQLRKVWMQVQPTWKVPQNTPTLPVESLKLMPHLGELDLTEWVANEIPQEVLKFGKTIKLHEDSDFSKMLFYSLLK
jgi:leucine-rich repeat protein SHOC2